MESKRKRKKGDITDSMVLLITLFVMAVGLFIVAWIIPVISNGLNTAGLNNTVEGTNAINQLAGFGNNGIQKGFFFLFIGLLAAELISAFYIDSHPIWLFLYFIFLVLTIIIGAYLGNAYEQMTQVSNFAGFSQTYITVIMQHLLQIIIGVGALSLIIMFSKFAYGNSVQRL